MHAVFLIPDAEWSGRARAFVVAARGLAQRGHEVLLVCQEECPVQVRIAGAGVPVAAMPAGTGAAGSALQLRQLLRQREMGVVFVHSEAEHLAAASALRFGRGGAVVRRVPPFAVGPSGRLGRVAAGMAASGLLFSTRADRDAAGAGGPRLPAAVAPIGLDPAEHDAARAASRAELGLAAGARLIVCVHDGVDVHQVLTAMRTLSLLAARHPELHLAILGAVRTDELRMQAAALGITASVSFPGARDDELGVLRAADAGWIAAQGDAAAFGALDFMAFRVPVIAERSPLTEHYIADGIAGVLLPPADPPLTAAAVAAFLAKDEQRVAMGNAGRLRLQRDFPLEPMVRGFEEAAEAAGRPQAQPVA